MSPSVSSRCASATRKSRQRRRFRGVAVAAAAATMLLAVACGRSGTSTPSGGSSTSPAAPSSSATAAAAGTFGSLTKVCGPGSGTGGSGRGVSSGAVHIGIINDAGNTVAPGLGQEFLDVGKAFTTWCNAAGGIHGRKIVVDNLPANIFNGAQVTISACQKDFMLIGGGTSSDATSVKPRLACKLGQIPAYTVSPQAGSAGLQVQPTVNPITSYQIGEIRLLTDAYPDAKQGLAIGSSNIQSLAPQGERAQEAAQGLGIKVTTLQARPYSIPNYRPYIEQMKTSGSKADYETTSQDFVQIATAMSDVGYSPAYLALNTALYADAAVRGAKSLQKLPPTYVGLLHAPWELAGQIPAVQQARNILTAAVSKPQYDDFSMLAFNAWTLFAVSANACGDNLTQDCVLQKAATYSDWTAGGLFPPRSTDPQTQQPTNCVILMRLTTNGWSYDRSVTKPNQGIYNCDPKNLATVKSFLTS